MKKMNKMVVFDFDGVISNSIHDSYVTALNTYIGLVNDHHLPVQKPVDPAADIFAFEKKYPELFQAFRTLLPMGNRAEDYYVFMQVMDQNLVSRVQDQNDFEKFKATLSKTEMVEYSRAFYARRSMQQKKDPEAWSEMLPAFPGMIEAIQALSRRFILTIATSKDRESVDLQLSHYGLTPVFPDRHIVDKDFAESKRDHLNYLQKTFGIPFPSIYFIDDKVLHLVSVKDLQVRCFLAGWGFNTARECEIAVQEGFHVLQLEELARLE